MALNDIYKITLTIAYDAAASIILQNTFYYKEVTQIPGNDDSQELAAQFKVVLLPKILDVISDSAHVAGLAVQNIIPGPDNVFETYGVTDFVGARIGQKMPAFNAWAFRLNRTTTAIRNGAKRFGPISEDDQNNGVAVGTITTALNALASQLGANLGTLGTTSTYAPRIFRPAREAVTIPAKTIPALLQRDEEVGSVSFVRLTSQTSRK